MPRKPRPDSRLAAEWRSMARSNTASSGELQRISIADNGPGVTPDDLSKIFVPFYTTKTNGTGLGLAIVQKIVVQHGGSVEVRNQPQGGAEFIVWLPLSRQGTAAGGTVDSRLRSVI